MTIKSFGLRVTGGYKYSDKLFRPEKEPSTFRQRILDLVLGDNGLFHRVWHDSLRETMLATSTRNARAPSLLPDLVSLSPFSAMEFSNDPFTVPSGYLHGLNIIIRTFTFLRRPGALSASTKLLRLPTTKLRPRGVHYCLSDDFDWFLLLAPDPSDPKVLRRIGLLSKETLCERGFVATGSGDSEDAVMRFTMFLRWRGDFSGTALAGLEDNFIDVDVPPHELGAFVERHLLSKTDRDRNTENSGTVCSTLGRFSHNSV